MTYEQQQRRLFALEDMLTAIEDKHGMGCKCETCTMIIEEMRFVQGEVKHSGEGK